MFTPFAEQVTRVCTQIPFEFGALHLVLRGDAFAYQRLSAGRFSFCQYSARSYKLPQRIREIRSCFRFGRPLRIHAGDLLNPCDISGADFFVYSRQHIPTLYHNASKPTRPQFLRPVSSKQAVSAVMTATATAHTISLFVRLCIKKTRACSPVYILDPLLDQSDIQVGR